MRSRLVHYLGLILLTGVAASVALTAGLGRFFGVLSAPPPSINGNASVRVPVEICEALPEAVEVLRQYSGMVRPRERYTLSFQVAGQISELGQNAEGRALDEGDRVTAGEMLARLDERILASQCKEAKARLEKAQYDRTQADQLRERNRTALSDSEYQERITQLSLAEAAVEMTEKRLADAQLLSPVDGVISRRFRKAGEALNMHEPVFEVIQVESVLLVLGVPEAEIQEIRVGQVAHVDLLARNKYRQSSQRIEGRVFRVDEAADDKTGLFEVEVEIPNANRELRPGLIATGRIVIDVIEGFRLPKIAAVFRDGQTSLFAIDAELRARQRFPERWIEQEATIILPLDQLPADSRRVVVRGQHRLIDGRDVELSNSPTPESEATPVVGRDGAPLAPTSPAPVSTAAST